MIVAKRPLMARKHTTRICREGYYYLFVLGFVISGAILREINLLLALAGMMTGPLLLNWRMAVDALRGVSVRRRLPQRVGAGDPFVVDLLLEKKPSRSSLLRLPCWALVVEDAVAKDSIAEEQATHRRERKYPRAIAWRIACGEQQRISYRGRIWRRGRYTLGPLRLSTRFPIGLIRRTMIDRQAASLTVLPRLGRLSEAWYRLYQKATGDSRSRSQRQVVREGEFHGLRDWRHGDVRRWIHWRTTARRGTPVVRQFERRETQEFALLVDLAPADLSRASEDDALEKAISFAATIVADVCRRAEGQFALSVGGADLAVIQGAASARMSERMLETLAVAEPGVSDGLEALLVDGTKNIKPGTSIVLITTRANGPSDEELAAILSGDARQREILPRLRVLNVHDEEIDSFFYSPDEEPGSKSQSTGGGATDGRATGGSSTNSNGRKNQESAAAATNNGSS